LAQAYGSRLLLQVCPYYMYIYNSRGMMCARCMCIVLSCIACQAQGTSQEAIAILTTGTEARFIQPSKVDQLIKPLVDQGYRVDVYIQLVARGYESSTRWALNEIQAARDNFSLPSFQSSVEQAGARLKHAELLSGQPTLTPSESSITEANYPWLSKVMSQYSPLSSNIKKQNAGLNVLRRYSSLTAMVEKSASVEKADQFQYDMFLVTRDDDYWMRALDLTNVRSDPEKAVSVYSKNCYTWNGINDKTLLFGRTAAHAIITHFMEKFIDPEMGKIFISRNAQAAESILQVITDFSGMKSKPLPFDQIPTVIATSDQMQASLCITGPVEQQGNDAHSDTETKCQASGPLQSLPLCDQQVHLNVGVHEGTPLRHIMAQRKIRIEPNADLQNTL